MVSCPTSRLSFSPRSPPAARNKLPYHTRPCPLPLPRGSSGLAQNGVSQRHSKHQKRKLPHPCLTLLPPLTFYLFIFHAISLQSFFFSTNPDRFTLMTLHALLTHRQIFPAHAIQPACIPTISFTFTQLRIYFLSQIYIIHKQKNLPPEPISQIKLKKSSNLETVPCLYFHFSYTNSYSTQPSHQFQLS